MKILIVGLGSMGKRRARLAKGIDASIELCGVDLSEERRTSEEVRRLGIDAYPDIPTAVAARHPDAALVCTAPITHSGIIGQLLDEGLPVFTELNLVEDGYEENMGSGTMDIDVHHHAFRSMCRLHFRRYKMYSYCHHEPCIKKRIQTNHPS